MNVAAVRTRGHLRMAARPSTRFDRCRTSKSAEPGGACLSPAGGFATAVVQRAANVHVGLPAPGYLLTAGAVTAYMGRLLCVTFTSRSPWSNLHQRTIARRQPCRQHPDHDTVPCK